MWDRMIFALTVSLAVHFVVVLVIQGKPTQADGATSAPLIARLDSVQSIRPDPAIAEPAEQPTPLPADDQPSEIRSHEPAPPESSSARAAADKSEPNAAVKPEPNAIDIPVIRDPTYYAAQFLDEYPKPLGAVEPRYPDNARLTNISGNVTLLLLIDEHGVLNEVSVVKAQPEAIFNEAAIEAFRDMRFSPARKDGRAVKSRVLVTVGFESNDRSSAR